MSDFWSDLFTLPHGILNNKAGALAIITIEGDLKVALHFAHIKHCLSQVGLTMCEGAVCAILCAIAARVRRVHAQCSFVVADVIFALDVAGNAVQ